jgi:hypothetical protein
LRLGLRLRAASTWRGAWCSRLTERLRERHEVLAGDRVFVLLAEKLLLDQHVEGGRIRVGELPLKHPDRVGDGLAAENELLFFLPLCHLFPHRHGDGHHDRDDREPNDQGRHRVAIVRDTASIGLESPVFRPSTALTS